MKITKQKLMTAGLVFTSLFFGLSLFKDFSNWQEKLELWENIKGIRVSIAPFIVFVILWFDERRKQKTNNA